ncbi:hypothetical protein N9N28_11380, partial [Rubripirellula amarantea]|nr:hypothetical protein [Rubripirellula amarantea]
KVSARDLFEARKAGKSKTDIETIANESGVANLERELETFILNTSERNEFVRRRIADVLQECNTFCRSEMDRLDGEIKSFDLDVVQLEADLNEAKKAAETLRSERDRALKSFEKKWDRRIARFDKDLIRNADRISDAIVDRLRDRGFVKTLSDSTKLGSEVARRVDNEISATVADLDEDLSAVVGELHDDLDEQLELYRKRCKLSNVPTSIAAASGGAVVAGAGFFGLTSVTSAFATASSAWAAVGTAGASATGAAGQVGAMQATWAWIFGSAATSSTAAATSTATAQAVATSAAIGATVTTIATAGGAIAAVYITKKVTHWGVSAVQENRVPALVESALTESGTQVVSMLQRRRDSLVDEYRDVVDTLVDYQEERVEQIIEAIKANDPAEKERRIDRKEQLRHFLDGNNRLEVKMAELPKLGVS